jgi:TolB-like protein/tetratricopeptide (TPR) repeat protein
VLPFENAGLDPRDSYLSEGLSDELRDQLGRVAGIRVAARSSSKVAVEQHLGAVDASARLGVAHIVEGSIRRQGGNLRISVQLIEGDSGLAIWSETYERGPKELLSIQQVMAERIVGYLLPDATVDATPATRNASANEAMLLARFYEQQVRDQQVRDDDKLLEAIRLYRMAVESDPESALAHSRLAGTLLFLGDLESAEASARVAMLLDPKLSEVQNTMGEVYWARGLPDAGAAFARAVELNPNNPDALTNYATWRWFQFEIEGVAELYARALEQDRLSLARYAALGDYLGKEGLADEAIEVANRVQQLFDDANAYRLVAWLLELAGRVDQSIAWTVKARDLEPHNPDHVEKLAELYAIIGDFETALELQPNPGLGLLFYMRRYPELIDQAEFTMIEMPEDMEVRYLLAFAYNATGQFESALHVLRTTGVADALLENRVRTAGELQAFHGLLGALYGSGNVDLARELAQFAFELPWTRTIDWMGLSFAACELAIQGRNKEALQWFGRIRNSPRLPWDGVLRDSVCHQGYANDPVYLGTLQAIEERRAELRQKLPATLAEFGVSL